MGGSELSMRVLIVTKIFPNAVEPASSPFNRQQFAALARRAEVELWATIPWFPGARLLRRWSAAGRLGEVPRQEQIDELSVRHPRVVYLPKLAAVNGALYAASLTLDALAQRGRVDVVLGSWAYPDGYAVVRLARRLGARAVIKVHGSDLDVLSRRATLRGRIRRALAGADRVVAVSDALAASAHELGAEQVSVVRNGVDHALFRPTPRPCRRRVLFVGRVERDKGVLDLIRAVSLADATLSIVGTGSAEARARALAARLGANVTFAGARPHTEIPEWLARSDVLALPSRHEGCPNVVLEALACGRPVVATRVGGIPELVSSKMLGELVAPDAPRCLADALRCVLERTHDPWQLAATANVPSWAQSAAQLYDVLVEVLAQREAA
ncbi:MAG: glycosyltransferase [Myxococcales bacterium]|nr:glycosyltransferase [Myxococcales bacterium]